MQFVMKRRYTPLIVATLLGVSWAVLSAAPMVSAQMGGKKAPAAKNIVVKNKKTKPSESVTGAGGAAAADKNIKDPLKKGNPKVPPKPSNKDGARMQSSEGVIHVNNYTSNRVDIYVDGYYEGTVGRFGDLYRRADADEYTVYGKATDGSGTFGPRNVRVPAGGSVTWTLND
jgi:hypothetical protein